LFDFSLLNFAQLTVISSKNLQKNVTSAEMLLNYFMIFFNNSESFI